MASKNKQKGQSAKGDATVSPCQEVDRLIARGWLKDAVKQAKICQRDHPSPEHHRLLERVTLLRAQELQAGGMVAAAREVATHLVDLPLTDPDLTEPAIALLLSIGLAGEALKLQGRLDSPEALGRLTRQAADVAVLHPERSSGVTPEVIDGAKRVREALEAITTGDEPRGLDLLREVSRSSPFADWRFFARGLAASRRGEDAEAETSWSRLDPARAAARIARSLTAVIAPETPSDDPALKAKRDKLERWAFGEPLLGPLRSLAHAMALGDWNATLSKVGLTHQSLRRFDPALAIRLTRALIAPLAQAVMGLDNKVGPDLANRFTKAVEPLPIDPRWLRFWALLWEGPQADVAGAVEFWRTYLKEIEKVPAVRPEDRETVRALVFAHLGGIYADYAGDPTEDDLADRYRLAELEKDRGQAISFLETSLEHRPTHRATYRLLMGVYEDAEDTDKVAEVARRLLAVLPDDFEALELLAKHHFDRDEPALGLEFAAKARRLKPLDRGATHREWACLVALARQDALAKRWEEGRGHLADAARLDPESSVGPHFVARQIALERKAKETDRAESLVAEALKRFPEAASLRLALAIEARRFKLPKLEITQAEAIWGGEAAQKVRGDSAGGMAKIMNAFLDQKTTYTGFKTHVRQVHDYLARTTRIKYALLDLTEVCKFLSAQPTGKELNKKLATRGMKLFPDAPEFPLILGALEIGRGYHANTYQARKYLNQSLKLAQAQEQTNPRAATLIPKIQQVLAILDEMARDPFGFAFSFPFPGGSGGAKGGPAAMFDAMGMGGYDDDDEFDDDFDDEPAPAPAPRPRPKGKQR